MRILWKDGHLFFSVFTAPAPSVANRKEMVLNVWRRACALRHICARGQTECGARALLTKKRLDSTRSHLVTQAIDWYGYRDCWVAHTPQDMEYDLADRNRSLRAHAASWPSESVVSSDGRSTIIAVYPRLVMIVSLRPQHLHNCAFKKKPILSVQAELNGPASGWCASCIRNRLL